jgi:hypothetical protein
MDNQLKKQIKQRLKQVHERLGHLDEKYFRIPVRNQFPPVFILGVPRSGSTLLGQIVLSAFHLAYIPNIAAQFYMCPVTMARWGLRFCRRYSTAFESRYGYERGCMAPSEAGPIWNRWFPSEQKEGFNYTPSGYMRPDAQFQVRQLVAHFERLFKAPFFTKNLKMSVRLQSLREIFPESLFITVHREPFETARSILLYRRKYQRYPWWSVMPREIGSLMDLPDVDQVCHQVYYLEKNMTDDLRLFPSYQSLSINFNALCKDPRKYLKRIEDFLIRGGLSVRKKTTDIPEKFNPPDFRRNEYVNQNTINRIESTLKALYHNDRTE